MWNAEYLKIAVRQAHSSTANSVRVFLRKKGYWWTCKAWLTVTVTFKALNFEFTAPACRYCFYQVLLPLLSPYFRNMTVTFNFRCIFHLPSIFPHFLFFYSPSFLPTLYCILILVHLWSVRHLKLLICGNFLKRPRETLLFAGKYTLLVSCKAYVAIFLLVQCGTAGGTTGQACPKLFFPLFSAGLLEVLLVRPVLSYFSPCSVRDCWRYYWSGVS
jgi:hypothetical protein